MPDIAASVLVKLRKKDVDIQKRWLNFCKKVLHFELDLHLVIEIIIQFTLPPFKAMINENEFFGIWSSDERKYN